MPINTYYVCAPPKLRRSKRYVVYVDTKDYVADHILMSHGINRIKFLGEYVRPDDGNEYMVITARIRTADLETFHTCMEELKNAMFLKGHIDYEDYCHSLWGGLLAPDGRKETT